MLFHLLPLAFAACLGAVSAQDLQYEYIVIGSGAGGGPLAARLAQAGHKTLLIEAGDDQGASDNYTVPAYSAKSTEDPNMSWDFFVRHYADDARQEKDFKLTYDTPDGGEYTGLDPPPGSTIKGVLYPRSAQLGGCTGHNALIAVYPDRTDFQGIVDLTGDESWAPDNMRKYFVKMESNRYLALNTSGHGFDGWFGTAEGPVNLVAQDPQLASLLLGGGFALGNATNTVQDFTTLLAGDPNADTTARDTTSGFYQIPISTKDRARSGSRDFVVQVRDAQTVLGEKQFPLDVRLNCHVTKVVFDNSSTPRATGVEFLDGKNLYRAHKLSGSASAGTPGSASASREIIVSGGVYNSPQILKLSGVGPAEELQSFGIPVVKNLPGVGTNLQDHYEVTLQGKAPTNFTTFTGCTFGFFGQPDPCLDEYKVPVRDGVTYDSPGLVAALYYKSSTTPDGNYDEFIFGGPVNFRGYFPNYSVNATIEHDWWTWAMLKAHPRNRAGTVTLRSADPLDVPSILFNYFDTGSPGADDDLQTIYESINIGRDAIKRQAVPIEEILPGPDVQTKEQIFDYIKNTAWGHHASCTCPIGTDDDPMAVLDSSFRVRGVQGLRVVDASVYPRIPGTFTAVSTYLVGEKAADVILTQLAESEK